MKTYQSALFKYGECLNTLYSVMSQTLWSLKSFKISLNLKKKKKIENALWKKDISVWEKYWSKMCLKSTQKFFDISC